MEPRYDNVYPDVIYDEDEKIYKCWYNPFVVDARVTSTPPERRHPDVIRYNDVKPTDREIGLCYAVSTDGIRWEKRIWASPRLRGQKEQHRHAPPRGRGHLQG